MNGCGKPSLDCPKHNGGGSTLYHEFGLTYEQIAKMEGCKKQSVYDSVILAEKKIREKIKNLEN